MEKQEKKRKESEFALATIASMVKTFGKPSCCMGALAQVVATFLTVWETSPEEDERILKEFQEDILERMGKLKDNATKKPGNGRQE